MKVEVIGCKTCCGSKTHILMEVSCKQISLLKRKVFMKVHVWHWNRWQQKIFSKKKKKIERNNHLKFRNTFWNTRTINEHTVFGPFYQNVKLAPVHRFSNCKFLYTSKKNSPTLKVFFRHLVKVTLSPPRPELFNLLHWKTFKSNKFFFFTLKALFFLKIFTFLFCCFDHVGKADWLKR